MTEPYRIGGAIGSPYTRKLKAVLQYRRLPYWFIQSTTNDYPGLPKPPLPLLPCLWMPNADGSLEATSDSTFQIRTLEERESGRSVIPTDPAVAFLDYLIEDFGDEWLTKAMFHYRWGIPENVEHASQVLPLWNIGIPDSTVDFFRANFAKRQIDRLSGVVTGSIEVCGPIIEASYVRLLEILRTRFTEHKFLLGDRPGTGDFGLYGQLTQLVQVEPTSQALARKDYARVTAWVDAVDDLSGLPVEGDAGWVARDSLGDTFRELLGEVGRTYAPFMVANAKAIDSGEPETHCEIDGGKYWQKAFPYQRKCLAWLQAEYAALSAPDRGFVDGVLAGTGCEMLLDQRLD